MFPQAIGLAATWEPELLTQVAEVEAREARYYFHAPEHRRAGLVVRAPNADLGRDPRWGRTEECFGEDVTLTSRMAVAFVRGLQGTDKHWRAAALLKHFLANSNEDGRESTSSNFDERQLHEYYLAPFRAAVIEGGARAFMTAYNAVNGVPCTYHPLVERYAVKQWGQDGIVCTDAHAATLLVSDHKTCADMAGAVTRSVKAGITQFLDDYVPGTKQALERGDLDEADLDQALTRTFRVMLKLGLLESPERAPFARVQQGTPAPYTSPEVQALCRRVTQKSIVLLKNEAGLLPLSLAPHADGRPRSLALVGPLADRVHMDWYGGTPPYHVTPLEGMRRKVNGQVSIECVTNNDLSAAMAAAKRADVCVVCVGNHPTGDDQWAKVTRKSYGKEAVDRQSLDLEEEWFVERMFESNPNTVLVLVANFPYAINWSQKNLPAIVQLTHASQEQGNALADVLFGDVNPAGRLVQTWPSDMEHLPDILDYDLTKGRTYMYSEHTPLYPFGHGLSYTRFSYQGLALSAANLSEAGHVEVNLDVKNVGELTGEEVVQLYVRFEDSGVVRPRRQLVDFKRVPIEPAQTERVALTLREEQLRYWDEQSQRFVLEPGRVVLEVGSSSADVRLTGELQVTPVLYQPVGK
jgi:beta-glucosidase